MQHRGLQGTLCLCSEEGKPGLSCRRHLGHPHLSVVWFCFVWLWHWQWDPCAGLGSVPAYLVVHLLLHLQRQRAVRPRAQHVRANADGEVVGVHPAAGGVLADAVQHGEQVLEQDEVWSGQFVGHPK